MRSARPLTAAIAMIEAIEDEFVKFPVLRSLRAEGLKADGATCIGSENFDVFEQVGGGDGVGRGFWRKRRRIGRERERWQQQTKSKEAGSRFHRFFLDVILREVEGSFIFPLGLIRARDSSTIDTALRTAKRLKQDAAVPRKISARLHPALRRDRSDRARRDFPGTGRACGREAPAARGDEPNIPSSSRGWVSSRNAGRLGCGSLAAAVASSFKR